MTGLNPDGGVTTELYGRSYKTWDANSGKWTKHKRENMTAKKAATRPPTQAERLAALEKDMGVMVKATAAIEKSYKALRLEMDRFQRAPIVITSAPKTDDRYEGPDGFEVVNGVRTNNYIRKNDPDFGHLLMPTPPPDVPTNGQWYTGRMVRHKDIPAMTPTPIKGVRTCFVVIDMQDNGETKPDQYVDWRYLEFA